jgi:hypothetical protein
MGKQSRRGRLVKIVQKADRGFFSAYYADPITGKRRQRSTKSRDRELAVQFADEWEEELKAGVVVSRTRHVSWGIFTKAVIDALNKDADEGNDNERDRREIEAAFSAWEEAGAPKSMLYLEESLTPFKAFWLARGRAESGINTWIMGMNKACRLALATQVIAFMPRLPKFQKPATSPPDLLCPIEEFDAWVSRHPAGQSFPVESLPHGGKPGFVYVLGSPHVSFVKIGWSKGGIEDRLYIGGTYIPDLKLLAYVKSGRKAEPYIHELFVRYRVDQTPKCGNRVRTAEVFSVTPDVLGFVAACRRGCATEAPTA